MTGRPGARFVPLLILVALQLALLNPDVFASQDAEDCSVTLALVTSTNETALVDGYLILVSRVDSSVYWASITDGLACYQDLPEGEYELVARDLGFLTLRKPAVVVLQTSRAHYEVELVPAGAVSGTVVTQTHHASDSVSERRSVTGATVSIWDAEGEVAGTATTGRQGEFCIHGLLPGPYTIQVSAGGLYQADPVPTTVEAGDIHVVTVLMEETHTITGLVVDSQGSLVAGALIAAVDVFGNSWQTESDASGRFTLAVPPGFDYRVLAGRCWAGIHEVGEVSISDKGTTRLAVALPDGATLSGSVFQADGLAAAHVRVQLLVNSVEPLPYAETWTDEYGKFSITGLAAGEYVLSVWSMEGSFLGSRRIVLREPELLMPVIFLPATGRVEGEISLADRSVAASSVQVLLFDSQAILAHSSAVSSEGAFSAEVPAGEYTACFVGSFIATSRSAAFQVVEKEVALLPEVHLDTTFRHVEGAVLDASTRAPLAGVVVAVQSKSPGGSFDVAITNGAGRFRLVNLAPSEYELSVVATGYEQLAQALDISAEMDETLPYLQLELIRDD